MQSHGITLSFHREMADSSRELVGSDFTAAVSLESYPRFIKGGFQDYEGLRIKRSTADSKHVPSPRSTAECTPLPWRKSDLVELWNESLGRFCRPEQSGFAFEGRAFVMREQPQSQLITICRSSGPRRGRRLSACGHLQMERAHKFRLAGVPDLQPGTRRRL